MPASEIVRIVSTVAVVQALCDLAANYWIFRGESYQRNRDAAERAQWKYGQAKAELELAKGSGSVDKKSNKVERLEKKVKRAEDDVNENMAFLTRRHMIPGLFTSFLFMLLLRILGTEHKGKILGIIPFVPFAFLRRITARGLDFTGTDFEVSEKVDDVAQAASFVFIYFLASMSVKFYVSKAFGTQGPPGSEGLMAMVNSPSGQKIMKRAGIDPDQLKVD